MRYTRVEVTPTYRQTTANFAVDFVLTKVNTSVTTNYNNL